MSAMPRRRNRGNRHLPDRLYYTTRPDGRKYYQYRHPITGKSHGMGYDEREAAEAARQLNEALGVGRSLVGRVAGSATRQTTLLEYVTHYERDILPARRVKGKPLSAAYLAETRRILARIVEGIGPARPMAQIRQAEIAAYLQRLPSAEAHNQHRVRLIQVWRHAISEEVVLENLPERVLPRDKNERRRRRLTVEQFEAIHALARPAIQNAMDLSLNVLQRRADVRKWRFDDQRDGFAHIIQSKTRKHGPSAWLRIPLELPLALPRDGDRTLGDLLRRCRDDVPCPFLVHERPLAIRRAAGKDHPFQLTLRAISQGFADARDECDLFDSIEPGERPTFHECISLGQHLREKQGWTLAQIQQLRGHTTAKMTEHYQEGHEWTTITIRN